MPTKTLQAIVRIDYDEPDASSYRGCTIDLNNGEKFESRTDDPVADFANAMEFIKVDREDGAIINYIEFTDSVNSFVVNSDAHVFDETGRIALA